MPGQDERQQELFTTRAARLRLLDRAQLPKIKGTLPATLKAVLRAIDARAREKPTCKFNLDLLAADVGCERATIKRTLAALRSLGIVETIRTGRALVFRIGWGNLADFDPLDENGEQLHDAAVAASGHADTEPRPPTVAAPCAIRGRTVRHQRAHCAPSEGALCAIVRSASLSALEPPPPPRASAPRSPIPDPRSPTWQVVEEILRVELAIGRWRECVASARSRSESPDVVQAAIAEFREALRVGRFASAGALYQRLTSGVWPPPSESYAKGQARAANDEARRQRERESAAAARIDADERARRAALEAAWGPALDALDRQGLHELATAAFAGNEFLLNHFRRDPRNVRQQLLAYLQAAAERSEPCAGGE